jgi:hypothetical protein
VHHLVDGEGLRTTYAYAPRVTITTIENGPTHVELQFPSSGFAAPPPQEVRVTRLAFEHVLEYVWADFEFDRDPYELDVGAFSLTEIDDSRAVAEIRATGRYVGSDLRHYRITFDDHGTYDVVCERLRISYSIEVHDR